MPSPFPVAASAPVAPAGRAVAAGILLMILAVGLFTVMNTFVKLIGPGYHPFEAVFFRNVVAVFLVIPFVLASGGLGTLKTKRPSGHLLRAVAGITSNVCFFAAYQRIALADGMVVSMAVPIFATLLAIPLLGEKVGWRRWVAILAGFIGVLIALKPGGGIQTGSLFALAGTFAWALTILFVKKLSTTETPYTIVFYYMLTGAVIAAAVMPWVWVTPTPQVLIYYLGAGVVGGLAQIAMTFALKLAPASVVSPFEYTQIGWAVLFDLALWGVSPSAATLIGAAIVIATGLYIFYREAGPRR
jgi:drug/metabolite transporter (DMT)-like permease